jgi:histidinol-phosphate/aromatic aminotransferase/cobyric acid decarboxylase-like protein
VRAGSARSHGADIYSPDGRPRRLLDFSSTVLTQAPPLGWRTQARAALERLQAYPQTRSQGLAARLEASFGLPEGSVLVGNGSLECLEWLARAASGERVVLDGPFFGEYLPLLQAAGAKPLGVSVTQQPARAGLGALLRSPDYKGAWVWSADPANPSGLSLAPDALALLLQVAKRQGQRLVLDEALAAQRLLDERPDLGLLAATRRGLFVVRSLSKGLGLPGLRLGYVVAHPAEIAKLLPYTRPWSVNALAQGLGAWVLASERRQARARRRVLARDKADLLRRLRPLQSLGLRPHASDTGFFLLELPAQGPDARAAEAALEAQGLLVRPCHNFGKWGRRTLRLNPRRPADNARLVRALERLYA